MLTAIGFFLLVHSAQLTAGNSQEAELPSLPDAVRLLQLETINKLRQTNMDQENIIAEKEDEISKLRVEHAEKDEQIDNLTADTGRLRQEVRDKVLEREQCDNISLAKDNVIHEHLASIGKLEMEKSDQLLLIGNKTEEIVQLRKDFAAEKEEERDRFEEESTLFIEICEFEALEQEKNCKKDLKESESQHTTKLERASTKLEQCENSLLFMSNVMLHDTKMRAMVQTLIESQADEIKEANKDLERQKYAYLTCQSAANTTAVQAATISMLRTSLASALAFPHLNTSSLEKRENIASFMLELMESYNEQTKRIDDLKVILEKGEEIDDQAVKLAEELRNMTSALRSAATVNLDILEEQAKVIQSQGDSIAQLTPLLRHTNKDIVWHQKAEGTGAESMSTCSCLPRSTDSSRPTPAKIEYHCGDISNRSFSLMCEEGVCKSDDLPSCTEPLEWEEIEVTSTQQCQEIMFNDTAMFCGNDGSDGTREETKRRNTSNGMIEERSVTPCLPCSVDCEMSEWTNWSVCSRTCESGFTTRSREVIQQPLHNGTRCSNLEEKKDCNIGQACTVVMLARKQAGNPSDYFDKTFQEYQNGFSSKGESWIGLDKLHTLTSQRPYSLKITMTDYDGASYVAVYDQFKVGPGEDYVVTVGGFNNALSTLGGSMDFHNGMEFIARDSGGNNCASEYTGGWWYAYCMNAHPTGLSSPTKISDTKYIYYYHGGVRGESEDSWAEAEYLLVPN